MPSSRSSQASLPPYPPPYRLTDPAMSTSSTMTRVGRGGAGNIIRSSTANNNSNTTPKLAPPTTLPLSTNSQPKPNLPTHTGRGGRGNISRIPSEKRLFSFDEELALQLSHRSTHPAPIYHVGRGGWANTVKARHPSSSSSAAAAEQHQQGLLYIDGVVRSRRESDGTQSSQSSSSSSTNSEKSGGGSAPRNIIRRIGKSVGMGKGGDY